MASSFSPTVMDYNKILRATATLQQFSEQPRRMSFLHPNDPVHGQLMTLMADVREFMSEQKKFNERIEKFMEARKAMDETQRAVNAFVFEKLSKCKCIEENLESLMPPKEEASETSHSQAEMSSSSIPCTSTSFTVYPTTVQPIVQPSQPQPQIQVQDHSIDLELLKMSQNNREVESPQHDNDLNDLFLDTRCGTSFDAAFDAMSEERRMASKGPYKCTECEKEFKQKHGLQQHLLTHSVGSFFCDICGKRYTRQESVNRHKRTTQCNPTQIHDSHNKPSTSTNNSYSHQMSQKMSVFPHQHGFMH